MCGGNTGPCHTDREHFSEKSLDKKNVTNLLPGRRAEVKKSSNSKKLF